MTSHELTGDEPPRMLSEQVHRAITRLIERGELQQGQSLRIEDISRRLKVSPTPVREGLSRLAATGLVVHEPRRGFRVAPPLSPDLFDRLMDARELVEVGAATLALAQGDPDLPGALRQALQTQQAAVAAFDAQAQHGTPTQDVTSAVIDADLAFHAVILAAARNPFLTVLADTLNAQSHRIRQATERGLSDAHEALSEHAAILDALESGDAAAVERSMRTHLELVRARGSQDAHPEGEDL